MIQWRTAVCRRSRPLAVAAVVLLLAGCSSTTIDVPRDAQVDIPTPTAVEQTSTTDPAAEPAVTPTAPVLVDEALDCAAVLPLDTITAALELPPGFVTDSALTGSCAWTIAGNSTALTLSSSSGATAASLVEQEQAGATEPVDLGDQALYRAGDASTDPAATVVVLEGTRLVTLRSFVGDQASLVGLAESALAAIG
ncbi:hypothetical protein [Rathayibacter tritici]|uniref:hypothetical protein n=1 Tax=Rathayibacter tritici TaxID=33888 RepID=UPI0015E20A3D|nr:hypothetical protein [Rathayibacter tritici]